ncbi:MAG TPA: questin oxidase family protein [Alphaproteobacteria bacterium]|nr:questin oxidase family protein [Alphaproteobacteria bacterium]
MSILAKLLTDAEVYSPEYGGGLCNHLPMALIALDQMGATPSQLNDYQRGHVKWLEKLPAPRGAFTPGAWPFRKANHAAFAELRAEFRRRIAADGWESVLRATLPELAPGLSAAAFHGMIRIAMGVTARHEGEIASGLAYWAAHWQRLGLPEHDAAPRGGDLPALLGALRADARFAAPAELPELIDERLIVVSRLDGFSEVTHWPDFATVGIRDLALAAAQIYGASGDFTALHLVTGAQAAAVLLPYVETPQVLLPWLWQGMAAGYIAIGRPALPDADTLALWRNATVPNWQDILQRALGERDEHVVKLIYSALYLGRLTGDRLFRWLAARETGVLRSTAKPMWQAA